MINSQNAYDGFSAPWSLMAPDPSKGTASGPAARKDETAEAGGSAKAGEQKEMFGEDGLGFSDILDIVNPLQHIPLVSTIYRAVTGDEISPGARMAGGTLFGGPIGLAGAIAVNAIEDHSGQSMEDRVAGLFGADKDSAAPADAARTQTALAAESSSNAVSQANEEQLAALTRAMTARPEISANPARAAGPAANLSASAAGTAATDNIPELSPQLAARLQALTGGTDGRAPTSPALNAAGGIAPGGVNISNLTPSPIPPKLQPAVLTAQQSAQTEQPIPAHHPGIPLNAVKTNPAPPAGQPRDENQVKAISENAARQFSKMAEGFRALEQERVNRLAINNALQNSKQGGYKITPVKTSADPASTIAQPAAATAETSSPSQANSAARHQQPAVPSPIPLQEVPDAMLSALEKYQAMLNAAN